MMTLGCTKSETQWIYFLSHTPPLLYILRHVTSVDFFLYIHPVFFKHLIEFDARGAAGVFVVPGKMDF